MALAHATRYVGKPARFLVLAGQVVHRLSTTDRKHLTSGAIREKFLVMVRMIKAYAGGSYRAIPAKAAISVAASLLYFLNPFDLIPDSLIGLGLTDDFAVVTWVYNALAADVQAYLTWEKTTARI